MSNIQSEIRFYLPAIILDRFFSRKLRRFLVRTLVYTELVILFIGIVYWFLSRFTPSTAASLPGSTDIFIGIFLILFGPLISVLFLSYFYNTRYFRGIDAIIREGILRESSITYEVARVAALSSGDMTQGFLSTMYGQQCMMRSGIMHGDVSDYLRTERTKISAEVLPLSENSFFTIEDLALYILEHDTSFHEFLFSHGVGDDVFKGAIGWVMRMYHEVKFTERWWSRDNLGKINGLGKEFSYGVAYELQKYMRNIKTTAVFSTLSNDTAYADEKIEQIEHILSRSKGSNPLIVGEPGVGKMDILVRLGKKMQEGVSMASISGKRLVVFDTDSFVATHNNKQEFELGFINLLSQAAHAGNIVVVIENISKFLHSVEAIGVDAGDIMDKFLASPALHIVATTDPLNLHQNLEQRPQLMQRFESVYIENPELSSTIRVIEDVALRYEAQYGTVFTYQAIVALVEGAQQYITDGVMPDKAVTLLAELAPYAAEQPGSLVQKEFVERFIGQKTGIPTGPVTDDERDMLMHLEDELHKYVVGQDGAITAISSAMRRSRAGIQAKDKPMGTFLFLGSTGVGKTETAKALARVFFGNEEKMLRIDMSEFQGGDGLARLMGMGGTPGVLPSMLREHPYGVLLLDEFEKTSSDIHDLFLQILDEGVFSDGRGTRVNARNTIIIATSNAGSEMVWDMVAAGVSPADKKDEIIDTIVHQGLYKPELINRFDGVIIFEPLNENSQKSIAGLMVEELKERIKKKGYELVVDDALLSFVAREGYNPQFGARPMRRAIQDTIEEKVAQKILAGGLRPGDKIQFSEADFVS